jgi:hypothetical protein
MIQMKNDYVRKVHSAMQTRKENTILINKNMLTNEDIKLIKELAVIYNKIIIFGSLKNIIFNNEPNVYIVD